MDHYTHVGIRDLSSALNTLPSLTPVREFHTATGTDDARPPIGNEGCSVWVTPMVTPVGDISCDSVTSIETRGASENEREASPPAAREALVLQWNEADCESMTSPERGDCERQDLNLHGLPHWILNPARLPIPPLSRFLFYRCFIESGRFRPLAVG